MGQLVGGSVCSYFQIRDRHVCRVCRVRDSEGGREDGRRKTEDGSGDFRLFFLSATYSNSMCGRSLLPLTMSSATMEDTVLYCNVPLWREKRWPMGGVTLGYVFTYSR